MMKGFNKKDNLGITLVALVITIIILLILAGITVVQLSNSGLFGKSQEAKEKWNNAQNDEDTKIAKYNNEIDNYINNNRESVTLTSQQYNDLINLINSLKDRVELLENKESKVLWSGSKINTVSETIKYDLSDDIENYNIILIETLNNGDGDRYTTNAFFVDDKIFQTAGVQCCAWNERWCGIRFFKDEDKFQLFARNNSDPECPIRIIGVKI